MGDTTKSYINVPYKETNLAKHMLDIYIPVKEPLSSASNVLVFIHGGAWRTGDKSDYSFLGDFFASLGLATIVLNYQLSSQKDALLVHPVHVNDCVDALNWIHRHAKDYMGYNPRIYIAGHSAGAHISALIALDSVLEFDVYGLIGVEGIYDIPLLIHTFPSYRDFIEMAFSSDETVTCFSACVVENLI